jgi:hypothetical protein
MNPEIRHQLYGGEISDYLAPKIEQRKYELPEETTTNIGDIYETQIKGKQSINTANIYNTNAVLPQYIKDERDNVLQKMLSDTLALINQQINITDNNTLNTKTSPQIKDQTESDIQAANNNVLNALKELSDLNAI